MNRVTGQNRTNRLGKGLSALIGEVEDIAFSSSGDDAGAALKPAEFSVQAIKPNPSQPRRNFSRAALDELAGSIRQFGVLQPILLRPDPDAADHYQIIAGERRWRAACLAGLETIPAIVRDSDELELLEVGIIENVQRADLNPVEEAEAYDALIRRFGRTQDDLAKRVGKSRAHVANTIRLLKLDETGRDHVRQGRVSAGHARAALAAPNPGAVLDMAVARSLSVRAVEAFVKRLQKDESAPTANQTGNKAKSVDTQALEADLARIIGLGVDIRQKARGGELRIHYRSFEQLDALCRKLTA